MYFIIVCIFVFVVFDESESKGSFEFLFEEGDSFLLKEFFVL